MFKNLILCTSLISLTAVSQLSGPLCAASNPSPLTHGVMIPEYTLGFGDVIEIKFFESDRFNETVTVRPDGRITLQRMGEIMVAGMTPMELDSLITERYAEFMQNPETTVFVREFSGYQVYVLGQVQSPGGYPVQRDMTLVQAIASAGGAKDGAKLGDVMLLRRSEIGGVEAVKIDLKKALKNDNDDNDGRDLFIQPLDIVYVPKTRIASASTFMKQVYDGFLPPVDMYLRWLLWTKWN